MDTDPDSRSDGTPPETVHEYFVAQLRRLRDAQGLSQSQLARLINYVPSQVSMVETMQRPPTPDFAAACDRALDTGGALSALLGLIARERYPVWFRSFVVLEAEAVAIEAFEVQAIPGLFETEGYAHAMFNGDWPPMSPEELERRLKARLDRQAILEREKPPLLWIILDESVLRRPVGSRAVMAEQLDHLVSLASRPRIRLQVLPMSRAGLVPMDGSFTLLELPSGERLVYVEGPGSGEILPYPEDVERCLRTMDAMRSEALTATESIALIKHVKEELYERDQ